MEQQARKMKTPKEYNGVTSGSRASLCLRLLLSGGCHELLLFGPSVFDMKNPPETFEIEILLFFSAFPLKMFSDRFRSKSSVHESGKGNSDTDHHEIGYTGIVWIL